MGLEIQIKARTDHRGRIPNQDSFIIDNIVDRAVDLQTYTESIESSDESLHFCAVADGTQKYGKQMADESLRQMSHVFYSQAARLNRFMAGYNHEEKMNRIHELCYAMVDQANSFVRRNRKAGMSGAATIAFIVWSGYDYCLANIGDSPVYSYNNGCLTLQSICDVKNPHMLTRYLGHQMEGRDMVHLKDGEFNVGDIILLCTDGLTNVLSERKLGTVMKSNAFPKLIPISWKEMDKKANSYNDNCTVLLLRAEESIDAFQTVMIKERAVSLVDAEEMEEFWNDCRKAQQDWPGFISDLIFSSGYSRTELTRKMYSGIKNRPKWLQDNQIPSNRDDLIFLGIACGFGKMQINEMLQKASFYNLYSKNLHDAILLYIIEHKVWSSSSLKSVKDLFLEMQEEAEQYRNRYFTGAYFTVNPMETCRVEHMIHYETNSFEEMLEKLFRMNTEKYHKFMEYMEPVLSKNAAATHFSCGPGVRERYYKAFAALRNENKIPSRTMLIAVAAQLNLTLEKTDDLLASAGMMELYPKNPVEYIIIFLLNQLYLNNPIYAARGTLNTRRVPYNVLMQQKNHRLEYGSFQNVAAYLAYSFKDYLANLEEGDYLAVAHAKVIKEDKMYKDLMELFDVED